MWEVQKFSVHSELQGFLSPIFGVVAGWVLRPPGDGTFAPPYFPLAFHWTVVDISECRFDMEDKLDKGVKHARSSYKSPYKLLCPVVHEIVH